MICLRHRLLDLRLSEGWAAFDCPTELGGILPPSSAAAITSAGRSMWTPSTYVKASNGEYAGGSFLVSGVFGIRSLSESWLWLWSCVLLVLPDRRWPGVRACKWISSWPGVGGFALGLIGESGGGRCTVNSDLGTDNELAKWVREVGWSRWLVKGLRAPASKDLEEVTGEGERDAPPLFSNALRSNGADGSSDAESPWSSFSSSIGVMGGGGVIGLSGSIDVRNGDEAPVRCRRERWRCWGDGNDELEVLWGVPSAFVRIRPPTSRRMLPRSLP